MAAGIARHVAAFNNPSKQQANASSFPGAVKVGLCDRGPFVRGWVIDVSTSAARALGMMRSGVVRVSVE